MRGVDLSDEVSRAGHSTGNDVRVTIEELGGAVDHNEAKLRRPKKHLRYSRRQNASHE